MPHDHTRLLDGLAPLARAAGEAIMAVYATDFEVADKHDDSPVTEADATAERIILAGLARLTPELPVVAEEAVAAGHMPSIGDCFWLVDPLDGTREFIKRNGEFTVNIALVEHGRPVLGVVLAPAQARMYTGAVGAGAHVHDAQGTRPIHCRVAPEAGLTVVTSRYHHGAEALKACLGGRRVNARVSVGSSLKLCLVAEGRADVYPRLGRTMEWDIAAGHAVLAAAGGNVLRVDDGQPLAYGKPGMENPHFIAWGRAPG